MITSTITSTALRRWAPALVLLLLAAVGGVATPARAAAPALPAAAAAAAAATGDAAPSGAPTSGASRPADPVAHDPTMVREGGWYYVAITGDAGRPDTFLPMKRSRDLVHWQELGPVFTALPAWVLPALDTPGAAAPQDLWAPDLSWSHGEWRLYYAVSQFGANTSVIGLATTKTLDPASPAFGWHDQGLVLRSGDYRSPGGDTFNALDPNTVVDASGQTWLSFGSFFSGIWLHRLDVTGKIPVGDTAVHLAARSTPDAEENSAIVPHEGWYYLFLSYDYCCRGVESDYRTVVARSRSITGPYLDAAGQAMLGADGSADQAVRGGTELMRGYNEFAGAGGADIDVTGGPVDLVVNHYYDATDAGTPRLNVRALTWGAGGWPRVSRPINGSRTLGSGDAYVTIAPRGAPAVVEDTGCLYEGAPLGIMTDLGNTCQQWQLGHRDDGGTRILNRFSNDVAEIAACDDVDGGRVAQWGWLGYQPSNDCQRWSFTAAPGGWTTVSSVLPAHRAWTASGAAPGSSITVSTPTGAADQQFSFRPVGSVLLASATGGTTTLGVPGCVAGRGTGSSVAFEPRRVLGCQTWRFSPAGGATLTVTNADGKQLATGPGASGLRVVDPGTTPAAQRTWTLQPAGDGTWALASGGTTQAVRLLLP